MSAVIEEAKFLGEVYEILSPNHKTDLLKQALELLIAQNAQADFHDQQFENMLQMEDELREDLGPEGNGD